MVRVRDVISEASAVLGEIQKAEQTCIDVGANLRFQSGYNIVSVKFEDAIRSLRSAESAIIEAVGKAAEYREAIDDTSTNKGDEQIHKESHAPLYNSVSQGT